jgi:F420-dependent oxidoreductase-like protein
MIEGQEDVTWDDWLALARACEEANGIDALFRSDHYLSVEGKSGRGSLDAWATLNALAAVTSTLRFGTLVSPASFRHPSVLAKMVTTADHVSNGRVELGLGAGWLEAEHRAYGFPFAPTRQRMDVLEEQLQIVRGHWAPGPFSFAGEHYRLEELDALPKPVQQPHPPLIIGGSGGKRSLALAARYADEYNTIFATPDHCRELRGRLDDACEAEGRERLPLSLMTGVALESNRDKLADRVAESWISGSVEEAQGQLAAFEEAGVERIMLQHLLHRDLESVRLIGDVLAPAVS